MNLQSLKTSLTNVLPILDANLALVYKEFMDGDIARGAFEYVRSRHEIAIMVIADENIPADVAYKSCAMLAIDLRCGVKEVANKEESEAQVQAWWQCYRDAGFTHEHKFLGSPILPDRVTRLP